MDFLKAPFFIALDVDSAEEAVSIAKATAPVAGGFKLGPRLMCRYGAELAQKIARLAPLFIDNKYFDIPSTMEAAVEASFAAGASYVTVHAQAGAEALSRLVLLEKRLNEQRPFRVLAVT